MKCIKFTDEKKYIKDFIKINKSLYEKNTNMENSKDVKQILLGIHPLNKYFKLDKYLIYDNDKPVGRFIITTYKNDDNCYIGFFECINDSNVAKLIFDTVKEYAKQNNYKNIIGPVDASFWNKYRLKINLFDRKPYTGEPYNKDYYLKMFMDNNFKIIEHYTSNIFNSINDYKNDRFLEKYNKFINNNYEIKSPDLKEYDSIISELYSLLTNLYSDFPIYKPISKSDFEFIFKNYKYIINPSMIKLAYLKNKLVGFFISVPNYNNIVYDLNLINIIKINKIKKNPKEYVMLYMGVDQNHKGLGSALVQSIIDTLKINQASSIGALARDGKVTQKYADDIIKDKYEYVLLGCDNYD